jgi:hypothetical protein
VLAHRIAKSYSKPLSILARVLQGKLAGARSKARTGDATLPGGTVVLLACSLHISTRMRSCRSGPNVLWTTIPWLLLLSNLAVFTGSRTACQNGTANAARNGLGHREGREEAGASRTVNLVDLVPATEQEPAAENGPHPR